MLQKLDNPGQNENEIRRLFNDDYFDSYGMQRVASRNARSLMHVSSRIMNVAVPPGRSLKGTSPASIRGCIQVLIPWRPLFHPALKSGF